jgi:6-hydroxycyclohex-1-ene-1-carbonyl-CoA dehydrogenase
MAKPLEAARETFSAAPPTEILAWQMEAPGRELVRRRLPVPKLGPGDVLIEVAGCGLCHTDLSFLYGGVATRKSPPLALGHEVSGIAVAAGRDTWQLLGRAVVVPAVIPCGSCELCLAGRGNACRSQIMPGNDIDGGFASHLVVPGQFLCPFDPGDFELWELAILADAVSTPYQSLVRADVGPGDVVVVLGVGGIGTYGVQIASALGAKVIAVDIDAKKLERIRSYGAAAVIDASSLDATGTRDAVRAAVKELGFRRHAWKVFEMTGTPAGQLAAWELLTFAGTVAFVGFTMEKVPVRLGNLMAFDATAFGNWGCLPELYPRALELILSGKIAVRPFIRRFPLEEINHVIGEARAHRLRERPVLVPQP